MSLSSFAKDTYNLYLTPIPEGPILHSSCIESLQESNNYSREEVIAGLTKSFIRLSKLSLDPSKIVYPEISIWIDELKNQILPLVIVSCMPKEAMKAHTAGRAMRSLKPNRDIDVKYSKGIPRSYLPYSDYSGVIFIDSDYLNNFLQFSTVEHGFSFVALESFTQASHVLIHEMFHLSSAENDSVDIHNKRSKYDLDDEYFRENSCSWWSLRDAYAYDRVYLLTSLISTVANPETETAASTILKDFRKIIETCGFDSCIDLMMDSKNYIDQIVQLRRSKKLSRKDASGFCTKIAK